MTNFRISFRDDTDNAVLEAEKISGSGVFENLLVDSSKADNKTYIFYSDVGLISAFRRLFG
ncbi:MAG: hypothetical protein J6A60_08080 [Clostridia bacterium]|nr:hypothetical protein [Clostridia bacterium]